MTIFEYGKSGRIGYSLPAGDGSYRLPDCHVRKLPLTLPEASEPDVVRHYTNLSRMNFGIEQGFYPLGSCTMKYNPKINEEAATLLEFSDIHPMQPLNTVQGSLAIYAETAEMLGKITGMSAFTFAPCAGAHGELTGLMIMKQYFLSLGETKRTKVIVPVSAHGTNPASTAMAGFQVIVCPCLDDGCVDTVALAGLLDETTAGIMLTNPSTLGIFEKDILVIERLVHENGSLMYYDGANMNGLLGYVKISAMGFDIMHLNLHKTFSAPHGGGGPGSGPVGVKANLAKYLPNPIVKEKKGKYVFEYSDETIGSVSSFYGNFGVVLKAYCYLKTLGKENLGNVARFAVLNANYLKESLKEEYCLPITALCKHEVVFDGLKDRRATTLDVAKRLADYGYHPPTIYFPLLFGETMMIEPTETESKETLDRFIAVMKKIAGEDPALLKAAPMKTTIGRLDEVKAAKELILSYRDIASDTGKQK